MVLSSEPQLQSPLADTPSLRQTFRATSEDSGVTTFAGSDIAALPFIEAHRNLTMSNAPEFLHTVSVRASFITIWAHLIDRIEHPDRHMQELQDFGFDSAAAGRYQRWTSVAGVRLHERIVANERTRRVVFTLVDHPVYQGDMVWQIADKPHSDGTLDLTCRLLWEFRDASRAMPDLTAVVQQAVLNAKYGSERAEPDFVLAAERGEALFESPEYRAWSGNGDSDSADDLPN
jgi:hypothetical protein